MKITILFGSPNRKGSTNILVGYGCGSPAMTQRSRYPEEAYKLGRSL